MKNIDDDAENYYQNYQLVKGIYRACPQHSNWLPGNKGGEADLPPSEI